MDGTPGCSLLAPKQAGIGETIEWTELPGWEQDRLNEAWPALLAQCSRLPARQPVWAEICATATQMQTPDDQQVRAFLQQHFLAHKIHGVNGESTGLITGYTPQPCMAVCNRMRSSTTPSTVDRITC